MVLHVTLLNQTHGNSDRLVTRVNGARLERSLECRRREGHLCDFFKHTPDQVRMPAIRSLRSRQHAKLSYRAHERNAGTSSHHVPIEDRHADYGAGPLQSSLSTARLLVESEQE
jgi:hypothetical protein